MYNENWNVVEYMANRYYPVEEYKQRYLDARSIFCDAKNLDLTKEEDVEKCMWIAAMVDTLHEIPMSVVKLVSDNRGMPADSKALVRKAFPRKRVWNKWQGWSHVSICHYAMIYEGICSISRDADDFDVFSDITDEYVEKCEWISAIFEVMNSIHETYVKPILRELNMEYSWEDFYDNYYF